MPLIFLIMSCGGTKNVITKNSSTSGQESSIGETFAKVADFVVDKTVQFSPRLISDNLTSEELFEDIVVAIEPQLIDAARKFYKDWDAYNKAHLYDLTFAEYLLVIELNGTTKMHNCTREGLARIINEVSKTTRKSFVYEDKSTIADAAQAEEVFVTNVVDGAMESLKTSMEAIVDIQKAKMTDSTIENPCEKISGIEKVEQTMKEQPEKEFIVPQQQKQQIVKQKEVSTHTSKGELLYQNGKYKAALIEGIHTEDECLIKLSSIKLLEGNSLSKKEEKRIREGLIVATQRCKS